MLNVTPSIWVELFSDERKENPGNGRSRFTNAESSPEVGAKQRRSLSQRQTFRNPASQIFGNLFCQTQGPGKLDRFYLFISIRSIRQLIQIIVFQRYNFLQVLNLES